MEFEKKKGEVFLHARGNWSFKGKCVFRALPQKRRRRRRVDVDYIILFFFFLKLKGIDENGLQEE